MTPHTEAFKTWINSKGPWFRVSKDPRYADQPMAGNKLGVLVKHLNDACGGERERRSFLKFVFGVESSKQLTCRQMNALYLWLEPRPNDEGVWAVRAQAAATAKEVVRAVLIEAGQQEMVL